MHPARVRSFRVYGLVVGLAGFASAGALIAFQPLPPPAVLAELAALSLVTALSWRLNFPVPPHTRHSLDLSYMISALILYGSPAGPILGVGAAALGTLQRRLTSRAAPVVEADRIPALMLNAGTLVLMMIAGDSAAGRLGLRADPAAGIGVALLARVSILYLTLAGAGSLIIGGAALIRGEPPAAWIGTNLRRALELASYNVPLALLLVVTRVRADLVPFLLLAGSTLAASLLLRNLRRAQDDLGHANAELRQRAAEMSALDQIGRQISSSLDLTRVFETVHRESARLLEAPSFHVVLCDEERRVWHQAYPLPLDPAAPPDPFRLGRGAVSWTIRSGRPARAADLALPDADRPYDLSETPPPARSLLAIPLTRSDGTVIGALTAASSRPGAYADRHERLLASIARHASIAIENARNYELATVDQVTRLYLKHYFTQRLEEEVVRARRYGRPLTLLMMDLDGFKKINDEYGHPAGDRLLRRVGEVIRESLRTHDIPCRYGGEEFAVMLPETDPAESRVIAERIRKRVARIRVHDGGRRFGTTISIGIASSAVGARHAPDEIVRKADLALYQAKREGKDKVVSAA